MSKDTDEKVTKMLDNFSKEAVKQELSDLIETMRLPDTNPYSGYYIKGYQECLEHLTKRLEELKGE